MCSARRMSEPSAVLTELADLSAASCERPFMHADVSAFGWLCSRVLGHVCGVWAHTGAVSDVPDDELVPGLPGVVVERLRAELGARAEKVFGCLRTAAALVAQAEADVSGLRLAESTPNL